MIKYIGDRVGGRVLVQKVYSDGPTSPVKERQDLANHSPDGFEWGYGGSGPAQLALAILADATDDWTALVLYQQFKWAVIAKLPQKKWEIQEETVQQWIDHVLSTRPELGDAIVERMVDDAVERGYPKDLRQRGG